jgi:hypothetical protein
MGKYRSLGAFLDRVFRNDLNANFNDIDTDIKAQKLRVDDLITGVPQPSEVVASRGGFPILGDRLDDLDSYMAQIATIPQAVGDGVTDDTASIQQILSLAKISMKGLKVKIPKGIYKLTSTLRIYQNSYLEMEAGTVLLRCHNNSIIVNGDSGATYNEYSGNGNITITGGTLEGNLLNFPDGYNAIGIARGKNITIRNVEIRDVMDGHGIDMNACDTVLIENCRFLGYKDTGSSYFREAIQIAEHSPEGFTEFGPFDYTPCRNITIRNNYFGASGTAGTTAYPTGIGHHSHYVDVYNSNIRITGNTFEGMTYAGVRSFKYKDLYIANNTFLGCENGIKLSNPTGSGTTDGGKPQASSNIFILNNLFKDTKKENIYGSGWEYSGVVAKIDSLIIKDNIFENQLKTSGYNNIFLSFVNNLIVQNNIAKTCHRFLSTQYTSNVEVSGNNGGDVLNEMIFTDEPDVDYRSLGYSKNHIIHDNTIKQTGRVGVFLQYIEEFKVTNNHLDTVAIETDNTRNGIMISTSCKNGIVSGNRVIKATTGNQNKYGIEVTPSCTNVQVFNNNVEGKTARENISTANGNFEGTYIHSPNGTRYKMTVSDVGSAVFTAG